MQIETSAASERVFASLDAVEVRFVARAVVSAQRCGLVRIARLATLLGNGWLYPLLSIVLACGPVDAPLRFLIAATLSLLIAFTVYPMLKTFLCRARPCDYDDTLGSELAPLDRYSCPSGHAMTAAAYGVPWIFAAPDAAPLVVTMCAVIGWSRIALGHHYLTDVLLGTTLGAAIAISVGSWLY
jgi:undecaprenyl-diphosphatase